MYAYLVVDGSTLEMTVEQGPRIAAEVLRVGNGFLTGPQCQGDREDVPFSTPF